MEIKTKNFSIESDPKLGCTCKHPDCDKRMVRQDVLNMLQKVRDDYGEPMIITSGGRCPNHPDEVHRTKPADHQKRKAVDVKVSNEMQAIELIALASRHGFNAFGKANSFIHLGWRPELDKRIATWTY